MFAHKVSLVIETSPLPDMQDQRRLEEYLRAHHGVSRAEFHPAENNLLEIDYFPTATSYIDVLDDIREQCQFARLVGVV